MDEPNKLEVSTSIGFRLSVHYADELHTRALRAGVSPHAYVRFVLIQHLERAEELETKDDLRAIRSTIEELYAEFTKAIR